MSGHTPGPWTVRSPNSGNRAALEIVSDQDAYVAGVQIRATNAASKDARLIAAAPDLLAALRPFAETEECGVGVQIGSNPDHTGESCYECAIVLAARAAIAKAEGRQ